MSIPVQRASIAAWNDEEHVIDNRRLYQEKFDRVIPILQQAFDVKLPDASFYIWLKVPDGDDLAFTRNLCRKPLSKCCPAASSPAIPNKAIRAKATSASLWLPTWKAALKRLKPWLLYTAR